MKLKWPRWLSLTALLPLIVSCSHSMVAIHTDYITHEDLASYYVQTPDPLLNCPPFGQRLILTWKLPKEVFVDSLYQIELTIRYKDRSEETKIIPLKYPTGTHLFCLMNERYLEKRGILTYKALLYRGDCLIGEWRHQLWEELILFPDEEL